MKDSKMSFAGTKLLDGNPPAGLFCYFRSPQWAVRSYRVSGKLLEQGQVLACCPVNITEVYAGLRSGEEEKTATFLDSLEYLPVTTEIARRAGLLRRDWQRKGQTLSYSDVTIAAVALSNHVPLLTDNRRHFPMAELQLYPLPERV